MIKKYVRVAGFSVRLLLASLALTSFLVVLPATMKSPAMAPSPGVDADPAAASVSAPSSANSPGASIFAEPSFGLVLFAPSISATKADSLFTDVDGDGRADPGDTLQYTITISNGGPDDATGVVFNDTIDANTTLVPGSIQTTPIAIDDDFSAIGNVRISIAAPGLLANDFDPDTGGNTGLTASGPTTSANNGDVAVSGDGSFTYNPAPGFEGTDTFMYTITDADGKTDTATVTITVNELIWFINNAAAMNGDGRITSPFNSIANFNAGAADDPGDIIFIYQGSGNYDGSLTLLNMQQLIGQGVNLQTVTGLTPPTGSDPLPGATSNPTLTSTGTAITLGQNNAVRGLTVGDTAVRDISGNNFGTLTTSVVTLNGNGQALQLQTGNLAATFTSISVANTGSNPGIFLQSVTGSMTVGGTTNIQNPGGHGIEVTGSSANLSFSTTTVNKTSAGDGVRYTSNVGGTIGFTSLSITTSNGNGLVGTTGTINVTTGSVNTTNGSGLDLNGSALGATFTSVAVDQSLVATAGISINNITGSLTSSTTSAGNAAGQGISISSTAGGSTVNLGSTTVNSSAGTGVNLTSNAGAVTFSQLTINPDPGQKGLVLTNSTGTTTATSGTISTQRNTAVEISGVSAATRAPLSMTFTSVSAIASGGVNPPNGIFIRNTSGSFTVAGTGTAGSGGTIANTTGADGATAGNGIYLENANSISLSRMQINDHPNFAIRGLNVAGFSLANSVINGINGTSAGADDASVAFNGLTGSASITNTTIQGGIEDNFRVINTSGTLNRITFDAVTIGPNDNTLGDNGLFLQAQNAAVMNVTVQNSFFTSARGDMFQFDLANTAVGDLVLNNVDFINTHPAIVVGGGGITLSGGGSNPSSVTMTYDINGCEFRNARGDAILVALQTGQGTLSGTIRNNTIGLAGTNGSGSSEATAVEVRIAGGGTQNVSIHNNQIRQYSNFGILLQAGNAVSGGNGNLNATVTNNTIANPSTFGFAKNGIQLNLGTNSGDAHQACVDIKNNTTGGSGDNGQSDINLRQRQVTTARVPGYLGANNDNTAVQNFIAGQNTGAETVTASNTVASGGGGFVNTPGGAACSTPSPTSAELLPASVLSAGSVLPGPDHLRSEEDHLYSADEQGNGGVQAISKEEILGTVQEAIKRWVAAGVEGQHLALLKALKVEIADLEPGVLVITTPTKIVIDETASDYGWFVDITANDDSEFELSETGLLWAAQASPAGGRMDLLTALSRAMGYVLEHETPSRASYRHWYRQTVLWPSYRRVPTFNIDIPKRQPDLQQGFQSPQGYNSTPSISPANVLATDTNSIYARMATESRVESNSAALPASGIEVVDVFADRGDTIPARPALFNTGSFGVADSLKRSSFAWAGRSSNHRAAIPASFAASRVSTVSPMAGETVTRTIGTLPANKTVTITFRVTINTPPQLPDTVCQVSNQGTVSGTNFSNVLTDDPDTGTANDATVTVLNNADLSITKSDSPDPVVTGSNITYTLNFSNTGPDSAGNVTITDAVPANTTFVSASVTTGTGWTTGAPSVGGTGNVTFSKGTVANAETAVFQIVVNVNPGTASGTTITNTATVTSDTRDCDTADNTATATTTATKQADLAVTKADAPDPAFAGTNITYTINFTNNGPTNAPNVTVTDVVPANTTFVSAAVTSGAGWSTSAPAVGGTGNVVFSKADVANAETAVFEIVVQVNGNTAAGTMITNNAVAASDATDPTPGNNTGAATTTIEAQADLAVTKSDSPDPVFAGNNITYTINFVNNGPGAAQSVTVTDAVPAGTTFVSASVTTGTGWSTSAPAVGGTGNVVFSKASVAASETAVFQIVVKVDSNTASGATITNTVTAATTTTDPDSANNTANATTTVNTQADLAVTKSDSPDPVIAGNNITYTINFANNGPSDASTVTVTDAVPSGTTFVSASVTTGTGWATSAPSVGGTGNVVFSKASVTAGETAVFEIVVKVAVGAANGATITNTATAATTTADPDSGNNTANAVTTVNTQADLAVTKGDSPDPVTAGANITYTVNFVNNGPSDAASVTVTDATPANTTFVSASVTTGTGWTTSAPVVGGTGNVVFSKATVAPAETAVFQIVVKVNSNTAGGATITNDAVAASTTTDPTPGNNTGTATTTVNAEADLAVTKSDSPDPVDAGANITYTINFVNNGPSDAAGVTVTDAVPTNTTFFSASVTTGTGWSIMAPAVGGTGNVVFSKASVANGETAVLQVVVQVGPMTANGAIISNSAVAAASTTDPTPGNNTGSATTTVQNETDIAVTKTDSPDPVNAGANLTYTISFVNNGPNSALNVMVTDATPADTTFVSAAVTSGTGWSITSPAVGATGNVVFSKGTVPNGQTATFQIVVKVDSDTAVDSDTGPTINNSAVAATTTTDTNPGNNTATAATLVQRSADLAVTKTDSPDPVAAGGNLTYTINFTNNGPSDAANVMVTDAVPTNTTFFSAIVSSGGGWSVATPAVGATGNVVFSKGAATAGETAVFTIVVKVDPAAGGPINNSVVAASETTDPTPGNNSAMASTTVEQQSDLAVTKTDSPDPVVAGTDLTYTINFVNNGPSNAANVTITDAVPANTTFVSAMVTAGAGWGIAAPAVGGNGNIVFSKGSVTSMETAVFTVVVRVNPNTANGTIITNNAVAASSSVDPVPGNNTGTATTTVATQADLAVTKGDLADPVIAGTPLLYTINFVNNGPSNATTVMVTDALPANTTFLLAFVSAGAGWTISAPPVGGTGNVVFSKASVGVGETATFLLSVRVSQSTPNGSVITNNAIAASATADPVPGNNTGTAMTTVQSRADLAVTKTDLTGVAIPGSNVTYRINFVNNGPSDAATVVVTDAVPLNTTFVSAAVTSGSGWTVMTPPVGGTGNVTFSKASVALGETAVFTIVVKVNLSLGGAALITNQVVAGASTADPTPANSSASVATSAFDTCIFDPITRSLLRFSRTTGDWEFIVCSKGTKFTGKGKATISSSGCKIDLVHPDPASGSKTNTVTLLATANPCTGVGTATVTVSGVVHKLTDPNINDGTCSCP